MSSVETLEDIRQKVISDVEAEIVPSVSIAVAKDGNVIWQEAFGWADKAEKRVATSETIYSLASLTKPLTATGIMLLAEQGKIDLDGSIEKYISPLALKSYAYDSRKVTVRHLLHHTSGLPAHFNYFYADEKACPPSFEETLDRYGFTVNEPGTFFRYSNLGYGLLGFVISRVSQMPFASFMESEVFGPLGMNRTTFHIESYTGKNVATRYDKEGKALPDMQCDTPGSGSACSTSGDIMRFALSLLGNEVKGSKSILSENSIKRMIGEHSDSSRVPYSKDEYYCLGFFSRQHQAGFAEIWHEGGWDGASSLLKIIPEENLAVVTLINTYHGGYVTEITDRIVATMVGLEKKEQQKPPSGPPERAKPETPDELVGTWKGEIKTYAGSIPIMIHFAQDGSTSASVGDQTESAKADWSPFYLVASTALWVMGTFNGTIPTDDAKRYSHNILLSIAMEGKKLIGEATAVVPWGKKHTRMYAALSHYVELDRLES